MAAISSTNGGGRDGSSSGEHKRCAWRGEHTRGWGQHRVEGQADGKTIYIRRTRVTHTLYHQFHVISTLIHYYYTTKERPPKKVGNWGRYALISVLVGGNDEHAQRTSLVVMAPLMGHDNIDGRRHMGAGPDDVRSPSTTAGNSLDGRDLYGLSSSSYLNYWQ